MNEVRGKLLAAISLGDACDISWVRLPGQSVLALILSLRTVPKVSVQRPAEPASDSDRRLGRSPQ